MKKPGTFALQLRVGTLLAGSLTVLLTACGGGGGSTASDQAAAGASSAAAGVPANPNSVPADAAAAVPTPPSTGVAVPPAPIAGASGTDATPVSPPVPPPASADIPATTNRFWVAPAGLDSNPGTQAKPFKTIAHAAQLAKASTTVFVEPGSYPGGFRTATSGTAAGHIYYVSTTRGGAKIVPPASSSTDVAWDNRGSYVDIVGFEVDGSAVQGGTVWRYGIYNGGSYDTIANNHVHHIATTIACTSGGGSAIGVDSYYHGVMGTVLGNTVHDIGPAGCHFVQGIYISTSGTVKNNVVYRVAEAAIHLWHDATHVTITNNTVSTSGTGIIVGGGDYYFTSAGDDYTAVYNNIVYDNKYGISEQGTTGLNNTYRNNLVVQNTYNWTLKNGLAASATVSSDPLFAAYAKTGTPDLHLSSASPAIGRGTAVEALPTDIDGKPRNAATGYDIGAYQH